MASNYTEAQVTEMVARYTEKPDRETVENLAKELNKSIKSVIGKLSREGVYQKTEYLTKSGEKPVTKLELVSALGDVLDIPDQWLEGLEKAPKPVLKRIVDMLEEAQANYENNEEGLQLYYKENI
jgi:ribosomal protein L22